MLESKKKTRMCTSWTSWMTVSVSKRIIYLSILSSNVIREFTYNASFSSYGISSRGASLPFFFIHTDDEHTDCNVEDVLVFLSGSSQVPPLGFDKKPLVVFHHDSPLATASTCDLQLRLPAEHVSYHTFKEAMLLSLKGHDGFGCT